MAYEVHLDIYDGPFHLLLELITAQQVDVYEVQLASIVDAFLAYLERLERLDLELATEFLLVASTLLELKVRKLLPGEPLELDEELALFEARDYLLARLLECRTFSAAAMALQNLESLASRAHPRRAGPDERFFDVEPDLLAGVTAEQLATLCARVLVERPAPVVEISHLHADEVSVSETLETLAASLSVTRRTTLKALTAPLGSTAAVVACFLALLELYKQQLVELEQFASFGELTVTWVGGLDAHLSVGEDYDG